MTRTLFSFQRIVLAAGLAGLAATSMAQTPAAPTVAEPAARHAKEHRHDPAQRQAMREQRQDKFKQELQITAEQEPAWHAYTASMLPPAPKADRPDREALRKMTTPQRIERLRALHAERHAAMEQRAQAVLRLYAALTPEQQQRFDQRAALGMGHGHGHGHGPHHHRGPQRG